MRSRVGWMQRGGAATAVGRVAVLGLALAMAMAFAFAAPASSEGEDAGDGNGDRDARIVQLEAQMAEMQAAMEELRTEGIDDDKLAEIREQLTVMAEEIEKLRAESTVPERRPLESFHGLGPAASKVYFKEHGVSIGSYGEIRLRSDVGSDATVDDSVYDALRAIIYLGYRFTDKLLVNSEFEFEHASTDGSGSVSVEFLTIDYLACELLNLRAGLLLIPMGFVNEIHEPPFYYGAERPEVERLLIPSTWRENGVGGFGSIGDRVQWRAYGVNGLDATGFSSSGLRGGRQKGSEAIANHWGFTFRTDVDIYGGLSAGGSFYVGNSGQEQIFEGNPVPDAFTTIYEVHAEFRRWGLAMRGLWAQVFIDQAGLLSAALNKGVTESVAEEMLGGYIEAGYDVLQWIFPDTQMTLEPFYRFEHVDTQNKIAAGYVADLTKVFDLHVVGLQFKPHSQVVVKLDYRDFDTKAGSRPDEVQFSVGYVF